MFKRESGSHDYLSKTGYSQAIQGARLMTLLMPLAARSLLVKMLLTGLCHCIVLLSANAFAVVDLEAPTVREGQVLPALGISNTFGRWTDVIRLGYNPQGASAAFADAEKFLALLTEAAAIWSRVSGVRFEILPPGNYPIDHNNPQSLRDGIVAVYWTHSANSFAAQAGPRSGAYNETLGYFPYTDGFVLMNSSCTSATCESGMTSVLVHELGHLLGLGHSDSPDSIMYANPYTFLRYPRTDDIRAVQVMYGAPANPVDPEQRLTQWLYAAPPMASADKTRFLFKDNQNSRVTSDAMLVLSTQAQFDQALTVVTASTADDAWVRLFAPLGNFNNQTDIEIPVQVVVVDPSGYEYRRDNWQLSCSARSACFSTFSFVQTRVIKYIPGEWKVYVVEDAQGPGSPELLLSLSLTVQTTPLFNHPPMANVELAAGDIPGTVKARVLASDLEGHALKAIWHLPGQRIDRNGDRFLDNELVEELGTANVGGWQTVNFGSNGQHSLFVQVNDNGPRYSGQSGQESGDGFQTLMKIDLQLNNKMPSAVTVASSAIHQYRPTRDWMVAFPGVAPDPALKTGLNNIGLLTEADMTIQSCVRIFNAGQPASVDGLSHIDLVFNITDMAQGMIQIVRSRAFNSSATPTVLRQQPVCSGEFEVTTGLYKDVIQVGTQTFATVFQLIDDAGLRLVLREARMLTP
jgi:hypothetical protein